MSRLFVDCDDTLIVYDNEAIENPYGKKYGTPYRFREELVDAIKVWRRLNPYQLLVIWSGGGREYAEEIAREVFSDLDFVAMDKFGTALTLVRKGDIVIDDMPLGTEGTHYYPNDLSWCVKEGDVD